MEKQTGSLVKEQGGKKVLIHYGGGSVIRSGPLDRVRASLAAEHMDFVELRGAVPSPRLDLVYEDIELCKEKGVDFILAVGDGSATDSAKTIGYGAVNKGDVWDFYGYKRQPSYCLPIDVVLTIIATSSKVSGSSIITKEDGRIRRDYSSGLSRPRSVVMSPDLTKTLPDYQTACGCTGILMHTMKRYFTNGGNMEVTDSMVEALMHTVIKNAKILVEDPLNYDVRVGILWISSLSRNGFADCGNIGGDFASYALEHGIGRLFDVAREAGLAAIWGGWVRYVYKNCLPRFHRFAVNVMGIEDLGAPGDTTLKGICVMKDFYRAIHMPTSSQGLGIASADGDLKTMACKYTVASGGQKGSAMVLHEDDMLVIYRMASHGPEKVATHQGREEYPMHYVQLNQGNKIPQLGPDIYQTADGQQVMDAVCWTLETGCRHIDAAKIYGNEKSVGDAIRKNKIPRRQIFLTIKLQNDDIQVGRTEGASNESLAAPQANYIDLYLICQPTEGFAEAWTAMEKLYKQGRIRTIGVSNFHKCHSNELEKRADVMPAVNQVESHPYFNNNELINYCFNHDVAMKVWSPLGGTGESLLQDETLVRLAQKYGRAPAQIVLRWGIQRNVVITPKPTHQERIISNQSIFDFELSDRDMRAVTRLNRATRVGAGPEHFNF